MLSVLFKQRVVSILSIAIFSAQNIVPVDVLTFVVVVVVVSNYHESIRALRRDNEVVLTTVRPNNVEIEMNNL